MRRFHDARRGNGGLVGWLGTALVFIVLGLLLGIVIFPFGFGLALVGVILLVWYFVGATKRAANPPS